MFRSNSSCSSLVDDLSFFKYCYVCKVNSKVVSYTYGPVITGHYAGQCQ